MTPVRPVGEKALLNVTPVISNVTNELKSGVTVGPMTSAGESMLVQESTKQSGRKVSLNSIEDKLSAGKGE